MTNETRSDPMDFLKNMWGNMGFTLPGMVTPTLDTDELSKRIADLKAVEGWMKSNLSLLQMSIQALEMQRSTLAAFQQMSQAAKGEPVSKPASNPFLNPANWPMPWNMMSGMEAAVPAASEPRQPPETTEPPQSAGKKSKPKG
jgi:hypothetical protein